MTLFNLLMNNIGLLLMVIGVIAFVVSVITEVTKGIGVLAKIPTDLEVLVVSLTLCQLVYFAYVSYYNIGVQWYCIVGCIVAGFIVAFVAMYGWDKLTTLYNRFKK